MSPNDSNLDPSDVQSGSSKAPDSPEEQKTKSTADYDNRSSRAFTKAGDHFDRQIKEIEKQMESSSLSEEDREFLKQEIDELAELRRDADLESVKITQQQMKSQESNNTSGGIKRSAEESSTNSNKK